MSQSADVYSADTYRTKTTRLLLLVLLGSVALAFLNVFVSTPMVFQAFVNSMEGAQLLDVLEDKFVTNLAFWVLPALVTAGIGKEFFNP